MTVKSFGPRIEIGEKLKKISNIGLLADWKCLNIKNNFTDKGGLVTKPWSSYGGLLALLFVQGGRLRRRIYYRFFI